MGAQELYGIKPGRRSERSLWGLPVGAYGGSGEIMDLARRSDRCTKPERCQGIRWPWRPESRS
jgi:hypothetical protein